MIKMEYTTISIKKKTKNRLEKHGRKGQTWDELINEMLDEIENA